MPTNEAVTSSIVFQGQVPADLECRIGTLSLIAEGLVQVLSIQSTNPDGSVTPPDDSVAQLALSTANAALALAQSVQASIKETRSSTPQPIPTGDSTYTFTWSPPLPSTNYNIQLTFYAGDVTHPANVAQYRVLESSITNAGFSVLLDNIQASTKASYLVTMR